MMCHVLIIEDEPFVALEIQVILRDAGATSFLFADCEDEAIGAAHERLPALITSDVRLRVGKGPAAVQAIHADHGLIPVIYITASPEECEGFPPGHVLNKPLSERALTRLFRELTQL